MRTNSRPDRYDGGPLMPWMRAAIGVGCGGLVAGVAGMVAWIDDGSHYFELAVALASAGFLTLVACALTRVFASSHGSQDDAFRRGREIGYDAGFLDGHRTARPVVVPLRSLGRDVDHDLAVPFGDIDDVDELDTPPPARPSWRRDTRPLSRRSGRDRMVGWVVASRMVLVASALSLAVLGVLVANASVPTPVSAESMLLPPGTHIDQVVQTSGATPALVAKPEQPAWSVAVGGRLTLVVPGVTGVPPVVPDVAGVSPAAPAVGAAGVQPVAALSSPHGAAVVAPAIVYLPAVLRSGTAPAVVPVVAAPAVPLTAAQQTAADALAAAAETARVAAAAAAQTAATAAAAAEATRLQAAADAYAVAHPAG
jgi:hypothetical protein